MATEARYEALDVHVHPSPEALGAAAADAFAAIIANRLEHSDTAAVVLATGNSQLPFFRALRTRRIEWSRLSVLHMDEYLGLPPNHPASFRNFLQRNVVDPLRPAQFFGIQGEVSDIEQEMRRYTELLHTMEPTLVVMGIGENGHLAFNEPPADFDTTTDLQLVDLDEVSRRQQVGEGHFPCLDDVPQQAVTLTIPALLRASQVLVLVPEQRKALAVQRALEEPISPHCPASILRRAHHAQLHLDTDSASLLAGTAIQGART